MLCSRESVQRAVSYGGIESAGHGVCERGAIESGEDGAHDGDAECDPQFTAGFGEGGSGAGAFLRGGPDDEVDGEDGRWAQAQYCECAADDDDPMGAVGCGLGQCEVAGYRDGCSGRDDDGRARAVERGDLRSDADLTLVVDSPASLVLYRLLFGHAPVTTETIEQAVNTLLAGIANDFDALQSRADAEADHQNVHRAAVR